MLFWLWKVYFMYMQANMKLTEEQLAMLSGPAAVREYLENQRENIENIIKQNLAVGDIFKRENLQVHIWLFSFEYELSENSVNMKLIISYRNLWFLTVFHGRSCERGRELCSWVQKTQAGVWWGKRSRTGFLPLP